MGRHLNLVQSDFENLEKRILPRFPFCYLTFKSSKEATHTFEVKDISYTGMQLGLRNGTHKMEKDETIHGFVHWGGRELEINGNIKWKTDMRLGVEFSHGQAHKNEIDSFLVMNRVAKELKPLHKMDHGIETPSNLRVWLRADGPVEIFIWQHNHGDLARIQILMMENFIEWEDGKGLQSARVISKRDIDTPLISEDEYVFKIDDSLDPHKLSLAQTLVNNIDESYLDQSVMDFMQRKLKA